MIEIKAKNPDNEVLNEGDKITLSAFVSKITPVGKNNLLTLRTPKTAIGALFTSKCKGDLPDEGAYIKVSGVIRKEARAELGLELTLTNVTLLSAPAEALPISISSPDMGLSVEESLDFRFLTVKKPEVAEIFKASSIAEQAFRSYMINNGFFEVHTPKIVKSNVERSPHEFNVEYFGKKSVLAKSPQIYMVSAMSSLDRVFEICPTYRAQKHYSTRHLNEFTTLNLEFSYVNSLSDVMNIVCGAVSNMAKLSDKSIPAITFDEALEILGKEKNNVFDLHPTEELKISDYIKEKTGSEFVFITQFPIEKRPFYIKGEENFDLIYRGMEIATGGVHIHEYSEMIESIIHHGKNPDDYKSYLEILKYGIPPHGGARIGLERFITKHLFLSNIKEASMFPRDIHHVK